MMNVLLSPFGNFGLLISQRCHMAFTLVNGLNQIQQIIVLLVSRLFCYSVELGGAWYCI